MKKKLIAILAILAMLFGLMSIAVLAQAKPEPMVRKIVVFKSGVLNEPAREALISKFGGVKVKDLTLIDGKAVLLPPKAEAVLSRMPGILRIDDDVEVFALDREDYFPLRIRPLARKPVPQPAEVLPWGIDRIDAERVWGGSEDATKICEGCITGASTNVAILDTGIDLSHPDLKANIKGGINTINPWKSYNDDNGHGTHVAGIIAAIDNEIGVIGVGPEIGLYAVKVLNAAGSGYLSDVIEGLDWVVNQKKIQGGDWVVNMSLGTASDVQSFHDAVVRVNKAGITQVAAAGNTGGSVLYPAAYSEVIAVSATDNTDTIASWSSRGEQIDLAAPGVNIYSTYKGSTYKTLSGTSMAAPHVAGTAALVLTQKPGNCDQNSNGEWDPNEVQKRIEDNAKDLGAFGKDELYGAGLVNAYSAVTGECK